MSVAVTLTHFELTITEDYDVVATGSHPVVPVCDVNSAARVDTDSSTVQLAIRIEFSEIVSFSIRIRFGIHREPVSR